MTEKRPLTLTLFLLRLLSGLGGGIAGTLIAFVVYFLSISLVPATEEASSLSVFATIFITFAATLVANTSTVAISSFMDEKKYSRRKTMLTHVFLFNVILFFLTIPLYIMGVSLDIVIIIAALHFLLSAFISALIMEVLAGDQHVLLGVYTTAFGIFLSIGLAFAMQTSNVNDLFLLFGAMPMVWVLLQASNGFGEWTYDAFLKIYGLDALNVKTDLGGDEVPEEKEEMNEEGEE